MGMDRVTVLARRISDNITRIITSNDYDQLRVDNTVEAGFPAVAGVGLYGWMQLLSVRIDDDPTSANSTIIDVTDWAGLWVDVFIDSTGTSTHELRLIAQFADADGAWHNFVEGLWASLCWEDVDTAAGIYQSFNLPCGGRRLVRFRVVGTNTTIGNYFDIVVKVRPYRPAIGMAHA